MALYRAREDSLHERANMISSAKADGRAEGRLEGMLEIAKNMYASGLEIEVISKFTKLPIDNLKKLLNIQ